MQVRTHVTVGRQNYRSGSLQHMIAGKQKAFPHQVVTQVVGNMPGCMYQADSVFATVDLIPVTPAATGLKALILCYPFRGRYTHQFCTSCFMDSSSPGRVIPMGMGGKNIFKLALTDRSHKAVKLFRINRPRIHQAKPVITDEITVSSRSGHGAGIAAQNTMNCYVNSFDWSGHSWFKSLHWLSRID